MKYTAGAIVAGIWLGLFFGLFWFMGLSRPNAAVFLTGFTVVFLPALAAYMAFGLQMWKDIASER